MAELPRKAPMVLIPGVGQAPPRPDLVEGPGEELEYVQGSPEVTPEEALNKFRELGAKAKGTGKLPLDATKIAQALQSLTVPHSATARHSRATRSRSISLPAEIHGAIESIVDSPRAVPSFIRDAILGVAKSRVIPKKIIDQAGEVARARRAGKGAVGVTIYMDDAVYGVLEVLSQRTKLAHKAVIEACTVLYLQAVMASQQA